MLQRINLFGFDYTTLHSTDIVTTKDYSVKCDDLLKIICVTSGKLTFSTESQCCYVSENDCIFLFPGSYAKISGNEAAEICVISFSIDKNAKNTESCYGFEKGTRILKDTGITSAVYNICKEAESEKSIFSSELISLLCNELKVYTLRHFNNDDTPAAESSTANEKLCIRVMEYIDSRIFTIKNLGEIASAMGYNYSYISTLFHKTTGTTLNNYFKQKRMDSAKTLLCDSKMSISEIARTLNYSSVYAFSKAFKEHFGSSPGYYSGRFSGKSN